VHPTPFVIVTSSRIRIVRGISGSVCSFVFFSTVRLFCPSTLPLSRKRTTLLICCRVAYCGSQLFGPPLCGGHRFQSILLHLYPSTPATLLARSHSSRLTVLVGCWYWSFCFWHFCIRCHCKPVQCTQLHLCVNCRFRHSCSRALSIALGVGLLLFFGSVVAFPTDGRLIWSPTLLLIAATANIPLL
jgi:hypothetical protein